MQQMVQTDVFIVLLKPNSLEISNGTKNIRSNKILTEDIFPWNN